MGVLTIAQQIQVGSISQYLAANYESQDALFGQRILRTDAKTIAIVNDALSWQFDGNPHDSTLQSVANYDQWLCGQFANQALRILYGVGGGSVVPPPQTNYIYAEIATKVDGQTGSPIAGTYIYQNDDLIGATDLNFIIVNNVNETILNGDFQFSNVTGTITRVNLWFTNDTLVFGFNKLIT